MHGLTLAGGAMRLECRARERQFVETDFRVTAANGSKVPQLDRTVVKLTALLPALGPAAEDR